MFELSAEILPTHQAWNTQSKDVAASICGSETLPSDNAGTQSQCFFPLVGCFEQKSLQRSNWQHIWLLSPALSPPSRDNLACQSHCSITIVSLLFTERKSTCVPGTALDMAICANQWMWLRRKRQHSRHTKIPFLHSQEVITRFPTASLCCLSHYVLASWLFNLFNQY